MRTCTKCNSEREDSMFYASKTHKGGFHPWCKPCISAVQREYKKANAKAVRERRLKFEAEHPDVLKAWRQADHLRHKAERNAKARAYYQAHKAEVIAYQKQYAKDHPESVAEYKRRNKASRPDTVKAEYERNKTAYFARAAERRAIKTSRLPAWADKEVINEFYRVAQAFNAQYPEIGFHVDHIVPLKSKLVSGLHTDANLQILTGRENMTKGNRTWPNQYS